jgi:predicted PurR-regulated permease PerM
MENEKKDMGEMHISFQKLFFTIATVFALFAILIVARAILVPFGFALVITFILIPMVRKFEYWGIGRIFAAFLSIFAVTLLIGGGIFLFSAQIISLSKQFSQFQDKVLGIFAEATSFINSNIPFIPYLEIGELYDLLRNWVSDSSASLVTQTFKSTTTLLTDLLATIVFTFLLLIYRSGFKHAFVQAYPENKRARAVKMLTSVQQVGQRYLIGVILIILILGMINSIGLWIIGLDNPFLFGYLAAILAIIPYIGTTIGAAIPILYALMAYDSVWMAIAVAILFWSIQVVESNFLSPRVVGGSLKVNALAAILSIFIGASVWGIAGMILFLPFTAMLKVVCDEYEELKPIGMLIGEQPSANRERGVKTISGLKNKIKPLFKKTVPQSRNEQNSKTEE